MKPLLVVNPQSGGGKTRKVFPELRKVIERRLGAIDAEHTNAPGHAIALAAEGARQGRDLIIAVGGDGTLSEVVNGVLTSGKSPHVGLIGQGTGGDFRKALDLEHRLDVYLDTLTKERTRRVDVGLARFVGHDGQPRERYFLNILSAGMGGLVDQYVASGSRLLGGTAAYFLASTKALLKSKVGKVRCTVTSGGQTTTRELESIMLAVCNGQYFGSGMHVAPMARIDDGRLEVVSMTAPNKVAFAVSSQRIYDGKHLDSEHTTHFSCEKIELDLLDEEARSVFLLDVDGEPLGRLPLSIEVVPSAVTLRA